MSLITRSLFAAALAAVATALSSLNILDAVGTYGFENMSSYLWTIGCLGDPGAEYVYASINIAVVPEPAAPGLMALGTLLVLRRVRSSREG